MKSIIFKIIIVIGSIGQVCIAQENHDKTVQKLSYGEKVPDYPLAGLVNSSDETATISDYSGKALILDYWFTGCKPCIESWPKLLKLQEKFGDKIQIMLVNHMQDKKTVQTFMENWGKKEGSRFSIPSITGDSILYRALPPQGYPSIMWIDSNGVFRAYTDGEGLNEENINKFIGQNDIRSEKWTGRNFDVFDGTRPLYVENNGANIKEMLWFSTISAYSPKVKDGMTYFSVDPLKGYGMTITHLNIIELIRYAYALSGFYPKADLDRYPRLPLNRYTLNIGDTTKYLYRIDGQRVLSNLYSYQLISKMPKTIMQLRRKMQEDIKGYFDLDIRWERRKKMCLVLKSEDTTLISDFKNGEEKMHVYKSGTNSKFYKAENYSPDRLFDFLAEYSYYDSPYPFVNETGFNGLLDLELPGHAGELDSHHRYKELDKFLYEKYKMHLLLEEREIDILIISEFSSIN